jgi:hypothetical protein
MIRLNYNRWPLVHVLPLFMLCASATPAQAQMSYSISVYSDWDVNSEGLITTWSDVEDNSPVCSSGHYDFRTMVSLRSPSGRIGSSDTWGQGGTTSLAIADEYGSYVRATSGSFFCGCGNQTVNYSGGGAQGLAETTTIVVDFTYVSHRDDLQSQVRRCDYRRCATSPNNCWSGVQDVIAIGTVCAPGIREMIQIKKFLGITYNCEMVEHHHLNSAPCVPPG